MTEYRDLGANRMPDFAALTYPSFSSALHRGDRDLIAIGAIAAGGEPVGLALGRVVGPVGHLLSLMVTVPVRGAGHGARLLDLLVSAMRNKGAERIDAVVPLSSNGAPTTLAAGLDRRGWRRAGAATITIEAPPARIAAALAARRMRAVPGWSLAPWSYQTDPWWAPIELAPAGWTPAAPDGRPWASQASVEIRRGSEREGWIVAHDMGGGWLRVSSSFLRPTAEASRAVFDLWRIYFTMVDAQGWNSVTFATTEDYGLFFAFLQRWAPNFARWWGCSAPSALAVGEPNAHVA